MGIEAVERLIGSLYNEMEDELGELLGSYFSSADLPRYARTNVTRRSSIGYSANVGLAAGKGLENAFDEITSEAEAFLRDVYAESYVSASEDVENEIEMKNRFRKSALDFGGFFDKLAKERKRMYITVTGLARDMFLNPDNIASSFDLLRTEFLVSRNRVNNILRGEEVSFKAIGVLHACEADGIEWYRFLAEKDRKTCRECEARDGKIYLVKGAEVGGDLPPVHYGCRCRIEPSDGKDYMDKPDTPLYEYTEEMVGNIFEIDSKFEDEVKKFAEAYEKNKSVYEEIAKKAGVPPELIAIIHHRENTPDFLNGTFNVYLHNGEKLGTPTKLVPVGKDFNDFIEAAIDAMKDEKAYIDRYNLWLGSDDIIAMMAFAEVYNGLGYYNNNRVSPYLYSGTNVYTSGKYVEEFDENDNRVSKYYNDLVDDQVGVYLLLKSILK